MMYVFESGEVAIVIKANSDSEAQEKLRDRMIKCLFLGVSLPDIGGFTLRDTYEEIE